MSVSEIEKNIMNLLSKPINATAYSNATEEAMYANDSDVMLNDSELQ